MSKNGQKRLKRENNPENVRRRISESELCVMKFLGNGELLKEKVGKNVFVKNRYYKVQIVWFKIEGACIKLKKIK